MKIKNDFITNSSSTSFVGWGIDLSGDEKKIKIFIKNFLKNYKSEIKSMIPNASVKNFDENRYELRECLEFVTSEILEFSFGPDMEHLFIAAHPSKMKDNETLLEFKQDIISELKMFGIELKIKDLIFIEEEWFDG